MTGTPPDAHDLDPIDHARAGRAFYWLIDAFSTRIVLHDDCGTTLARQAIALTRTLDTTALAPGGFPPVHDTVTAQDMAAVAATYGRTHDVDPALLISEALGCYAGVPAEDLGI